MTLQRSLLVAILAAYAVITVIYSIVTPLFEVSDELWHYPMVKVIADTGALPIQDPANPGPWRQEGSQPPLYYMVGAALTFWIDTSDMDAVRRINPHADIGVIHPDGNANMMVHRNNLESFPWQGTALAVHLVRLFSVTLGFGTVLVTYHLAHAIFPENDTLALLSAALVAFLPMFMFIHGSVNNDALSNLLGNLITLQLVRMVLSDQKPTNMGYVALGLTVGMGLLAKGSLGFLTIVVALVLIVIALRERDWKLLVIGGAISGGLTVVIAGWWYLRNWQLYGDPTGLNTFLDTVGRRLIPANPAQLWAERNSFLQAYWGFFGGVNVPLPQWQYTTFNILGAFGLISGLIFLIVLVVRRKQSAKWWLATSITLVWMLVTFISYLQWTRITPASQGRLVFVALSSISLWMAIGWTWWLPKQAKPITALLVGGYFLFAGATAPFSTITPMYALPPTPETIAEPIAMFTPIEANESGSIGLLNTRIITEQVRPSEYILVQTDWIVREALTRNWSLFVHLDTPDGVIIGQRDVYPGRGLLATEDLDAGYAWENPIAINVPAGAYAPMTLDVWLGWYHLSTGERMALDDGEERVLIGQVELLPRESEFDLPNPVQVNFDNRIELVGYELSTLTPEQSDEYTVTLYWRALEPIPENFMIFLHIINAQTSEIVGGNDAQPAGWTRPTSSWEVGEIVEDVHTFTIRDDALPTIYELEVGMYTVEEDGSYPRLRIVTPDGGQANDYYYLSRLRVDPDTAIENGDDDAG